MALCTKGHQLEAHRSFAMPVVAIVNQKGGTGKTTLATNLAWVLAEKSKRLAPGRRPSGQLTELGRQR